MYVVRLSIMKNYTSARRCIAYLERIAAASMVKIIRIFFKT